MDALTIAVRDLVLVLWGVFCTSGIFAILLMIMGTKDDNNTYTIGGWLVLVACMLGILVLLSLSVV
jgi:hypothetical protein